MSVHPLHVRALFAVALGSGLGGLARWWVAVLLQSVAGAGTAWTPLGATLAVNVTGSLLIGWFAGRVFARHARAPGPIRQLFFMTGFCGGYTTFSIFSLDTLTLLQSGQVTLAASYVGLSLLGWLAAVWAGFRLGAQARWGAAR